MVLLRGFLEGLGMLTRDDIGDIFYPRTVVRAPWPKGYVWVPLALFLRWGR